MSDARSDVDLAHALRGVFEDNKALFEELVIRRWRVSLNLPTVNLDSAFGPSPIGLADGAGFSVTREVGPEYLERMIAQRHSNPRGDAKK